MIIALLAFSGCASHKQPAARAVSAHPGHYSQSSTSGLPNGYGGSYKTGKPYSVAGRWYYPMQRVGTYDETGTASWYGRDFHGKKTANGERYDMHALSAAHKTLPMPTLVRVTNLENGRSVVVRVNDRGPFVKNRLIDLSYSAAQSLGYTDKGTARVRVQTLNRPSPTVATVSTGSGPTLAETMKPARPVANVQPASPEIVPAAWDRKRSDSAQAGKGEIFVQLGAFSTRHNAEKLRDQLDSRFSDILIQPRRIASTTLYRVRIGPFNDMKKIEQTMQTLQQSGFDQAVVIIE